MKSLFILLGGGGNIFIGTGGGGGLRVGHYSARGRALREESQIEFRKLNEAHVWWGIVSTNATRKPGALPARPSFYPSPPPTLPRPNDNLHTTHLE